MIPTEVPIFSAKDLLPPCSNEYQVGSKLSIIGWLKQLFLYGDKDMVQITPEDRKDYNKALEAFKKANGLGKKYDVCAYEDTKGHTATKQAKALNKAMKELGYE